MSKIHSMALYNNLRQFHELYKTYKDKFNRYLIQVTAA